MHTATHTQIRLPSKGRRATFHEHDALLLFAAAQVRGCAPAPRCFYSAGCKNTTNILRLERAVFYKDLFTPREMVLKRLDIKDYHLWGNILATELSG